MFGEGSFIGKGIYDVDAFEQSLKGRFPENRILSHDLVEGCYARSGLLSDVQLYETDPSLYSADVKRRRRWIRGDWQIARWLLPHVPGSEGRSSKNPLSALSRWKIFDNLRRSLVPVAMTILLPLAWSMLSRPWLWTLAVIGVLTAPSLLTSLFEAFQRPEDILWSQHLAAVARSTRRRLAQAGFGLACLPYEAFFSLDAILRTLWRMVVTRKRLLEWLPSSDESGGWDLIASVRSMWIGPAIATVAYVFLAITRPAALFPAALLLGLWFLSPVLAWLMGLPITDSGERTWRKNRWSFSASWRARPGRSLKRSSARKIIGCRRTITRSIPSPSSLIARRPPTWAWRCSRIWQPTISAISAPESSSSALLARASIHASDGAAPRPFLQLV